MMTRIKVTRLYQTLEHWRLLVFAGWYRRADRQARANFIRFRDQYGGIGLRHDLLPLVGKAKTALFVRNITLPYAPVEAFVMKALQAAGFRTVVVGKRRYEFLRYVWLGGNQTGLVLSDFADGGDPQWVDEQISRLRDTREWLTLKYQGVHVGRCVIATTLRQLKVGQLDFSELRVQEVLRQNLQASVSNTRAAIDLIREVKPDCTLFLDRGYMGQAEVCDLAIGQGIDTLAWTAGYKSNRLSFKRYHSGNERDHPLSPSVDSWQRLNSMPWKPEYGQAVRRELFECYETQDWFSVVGTQFDKQILSQDITRRKLGMSVDRKVAVIFPHILWDGSFFYGEDLFDDYTEWFVETIRAASANPRLQWIIKLHPAHLVKAQQDSDVGTSKGRPRELEVIENAFGTLPAHITLVHPDNELSTYSLFEVADYAVTVRGTVGIESALFGIPVVTAGTGRYDQRGFTLDSSTREEYLRKLDTLETYPRLSTEQVEAAERYAYGLFFCRPVTLTSVSLEYERDGAATPRVTVHCQSRDEWRASPDIRRLADWLSDGKAEDMLLFPT